MHMQRFASATPNRDALDRICTLEVNSKPAVRALHGASHSGSSAGEEQPADPIVWHSKFNQNVLTSLQLQRDQPVTSRSGSHYGDTELYVPYVNLKTSINYKPATTVHDIQAANLKQGREMQKAPNCIACNLLCSSRENNASSRPTEQRGARVNQQLMHLSRPCSLCR